MENINYRIKKRYNNAMEYLNSIDLKVKQKKKISNNNDNNKKIVSLKKKAKLNNISETEKKNYDNALNHQFINLMTNKIKDKMTLIFNSTKIRNDTLNLFNYNKYNQNNLSQIGILGEKNKKKINEIYSLLIDENEFITTKNKSLISDKLNNIKKNLNLSSSLTVLKKNTKNSLEKYINEINKNKKKNKSSIIEKINPHVALYEKISDIEKIKKSASCQTLEHMRKVLDYDKNIKTKNKYDKIEIPFKKIRPRKINLNYDNYYDNNKYIFQNNSIINNNKKEFNILFKANKIQEKIFELKKHFSIFPKINKRKYDNNSSLKYSTNNNINISSEIKDKIIENKIELNKDEEKNYENDKSFFSNESIKKFTKIFVQRKSKSIDMKNFVDDDDENKNILLTLDVNDLI